MKCSKRGIRVLLLLTVLLALPLSGCNAGITGENMTSGASMVQEYTTQVDAYQTLADQLAATLKASGVVDANIVAKLSSLQTQIDAIQPKVDGVIMAVKTANYSADDDTATVIIKAATAANTASTAWNPYAIPINIALGLISLALGWYAAAKKKSEAEATAKAQVAATKYAAMKDGVNKTLAETTPEVSKVLYDNIGQARVVNGVK